MTASDLFEAFAEVAGGRGTPREEASTLFAAMVGANVLGRAIGKTPWVAHLESVVLGATRVSAPRNSRRAR